MFKEYLINNGIKEDNIIHVNFESVLFDDIKDYKDLYKYVKGKIKKNLIEGMESAFLSKKLSKINRFVPIDFSLNDMKVYSELDHLRVYELYNKYELKSLLNKINSNNESYEILVNEISQYMYWLIIMDVSRKIKYEDTKVFKKIEEIIDFIDISKIEECQNITIGEIINHDLDNMSQKEYLKYVIKNN